MFVSIDDGGLDSETKLARLLDSGARQLCCAYRFLNIIEYICDPILQNRQCTHTFKILFYWFYVIYRNR